MNITQSQKLQSIVASAKIFGFLGVGIIGSGIVKNLLSSGHKVVIWNRDPSKSRKFEDIGAEVAMTPCDVAERADIIFSCVSDPLASKEVMEICCFHYRNRLKTSSICCNFSLCSVIVESFHPINISTERAMSK